MAAVAEALGVLENAVTLELEDPEETDRMYGMNRQLGDYIVKAIVEVIGDVQKESVTGLMAAVDFKDNVNGELQKSEAAKQANIALNEIKTAPIANIKMGNQTLH